MGRSEQFRYTIAFWLFAAPCIILFSVFFLLPLVLSIGFSFTNYDGWKKMDFVGLKNYAAILRDPNFFSALKRTFVFTLFSLPFKVIIPLIISVLVISPHLPIKGLIRTMIYMPVLLSALVVGITINWMFSQEYGLVNFLITRLGILPLEWSLNPVLAMFVVSFASNWASTGFYMIIFIGGLINISQELYEAAAIDGANGVRAFFRITLPLLRPTMFLAVFLGTINLLKEYALIQGITQGGPGLHTTYIVQYIFDKGFKQMQYGTASAIASVVMVIFGIIAYFQYRVNKGGEVL